jgi:phage gp29-like protein
MDREWWVRFLDKFGTPFITGKFDKNDDRSRQVLERAFRMSSKIGGLVVTKDTQVELVQAQSQGNAKAFQEFHDACNREISKRVVGQTLSSEAQSTGLGSGTSDLQGQVRGDIAQFDRKKLSQTIRMQLFKPLLRLNGIRGAVPDLIWGQEEPEENGKTATALSSLKTAGLRLADKAIPVLSKRMGLELERDQEPKSDHLPPVMPPKPGKTKALSSGPPSNRDAVAASDSISREAAASLSLVLRGSLAPARQVILESATPQEAQSKLLALFTDWSPARAAEVVETALTAGAWNGCQED